MNPACNISTCLFLLCTHWCGCPNKVSQVGVLEGWNGMSHNSEDEKAHGQVSAGLPLPSLSICCQCLACLGPRDITLSLSSASPIFAFVYSCLCLSMHYACVSTYLCMCVYISIMHNYVKIPNPFKKCASNTKSWLPLHLNSLHN